MGAAHSQHYHDDQAGGEVTGKKKSRVRKKRRDDVGVRKQGSAALSQHNADVDMSL